MQNFIATYEKAIITSWGKAKLIRPGHHVTAVSGVRWVGLEKIEKCYYQVWYYNGELWALKES
jgi:hypothetical protein